MEVSVECTCGRELNQTGVATTRSDVTIDVEPCQDCTDDAKAEGDKEGYERGYDEGLGDVEVPA